MRKEDIKNFVYFFTHNKTLTYQQKNKFDSLLARDFTDLLQKGVSKGKGPNAPFVQMSARNTSRFLSLFNEPKGLKYLTHDFDSAEDDRPHDLKALQKQCQNILRETINTIPKSLHRLINGFVNGTSSWYDTYGNLRNSSIADKSWVKWSHDNNLHPKNNETFCKEIMAFRSTVRVVSPLLKEIADTILANTKLKVSTVKLDKADFYTNTYILFTALKRILSMMERRVTKYPNISISFKRDTTISDILLRKIIIIQEGSFSDNQLEDLILRLKLDPEAGDFGAIRNYLNGYCEWSVESKWEGISARWNILRENEIPEVEKLADSEIVGFTHILTFYIV